MEPASFALAVAGIPGIFKSCIDCFRYIQFSKNFGADFGICLAKLEATDLQLSRWGKAMGFLDEPFDPDALYKKGMWDEKDVAKAKKWLALINDLFAEAEKASSRFKLLHEDDEPELLEVPDQAKELEKAKETVKKLVFSVRKLTKRRQKETSAVDKAKWALYAREDFNKLVNDISGLVEKLVVLFPALQPAQEVLCQEEASQIEPEVIPTLVAVLGDKDKLLNHALAEEVKVKGHRLQGATIRQGGLTTVGDSFKNVFDTLAPGADVSNVDVSGSLKVGHQYEISDAVALAKLGHPPNPQGQQ
ncbi:hypothetical protein CEP52_004501 [Fusarium oligoseptatum]|uniref:Prion-inhibition and propagation HeLo domain-containing protein n=1 Tax=Fusarium oligoseptatum TaxID=2604345 RepID=A0A428U3J7_9HYPO|nr:hypothetical protein CEP52_004501 [Fusarium oligoseptatum]